MKYSTFFPLFSLAAALDCRPEGPVLPKPANLADAATFRHAAINLAHTFDSMSSGDIDVPWPVENVSFSVAVVSANQDDGEPLWQYHHRAPANVNGTDTIDADSQYLIGSVSKMVTDYILLVSGMDLDVPVTKYLPLLNGSETMQWDEITLRMLASQVAGVPTNCMFSINSMKNFTDAIRWIFRLLLSQRCLSLTWLPPNRRVGISSLWCNWPQRRLHCRA